MTAKMKEGKCVALVTDAGMPCISDPGHELILSALDEGIPVSVVPGPSSIISALVLSGLSTDRFSFLGFAPRKAGERRRFVDATLERGETSILFESPVRLPGLLETIASIAPERKVAVARELTKKFEQVVRGTAAEVFEHFRETPPRGELVILIEGVAGRERVPEEASPEAARKLVKSLVREGLDKKEAMREAARQLGTSRREVYRALLESEGEK